MKAYYEVHAAKRVLVDGQVQSGETVKWLETPKYQNAIKTAENWLKLPEINSVWVYKYEEDEDGEIDDPTWQKIRYKGEKWKTVHAW